MQIPRFFLLFAALALVLPATANGASELGVDYAQGYAVQKPLDVESAQELWECIEAPPDEG